MEIKAKSTARVKKNKVKITMIFSSIAIFLTAVVLVAIFLLNFWHPFGQQINVTSNEQSIKSSTINLLVCGIDDDIDRNQSLTDVIMLISIDFEKNSASILQIPRDTYVGQSINTGSSWKINSIYSHASDKNGPQALAQYIAETFQIPIDHYLTITMDGFRRAVDSIGGVTIDIPYRIVFDSASILNPGVQTLNGTKSEWFVRYREGYAMGDLDRVKAQRIFVAALAQKVGTMSKSQAIN